MKKSAKILSVIMSLTMGISALSLTACTPPVEENPPEPAHEHTYAATWTNNDSKHWHESNCEHKGLKSEEASHNTTGENGSCSVCGYAPAVHEHTYAVEWSTDNVNHWYAATCEHSTLTKDKAAHDGKGEDGGCTICGWKPEHEHTYNAKYWSVSSTKHWRSATCGHYELKSEEGEHVPGDDNKCTVCGYYEHEDVYVYETSATMHWQTIRCSISSEFKSCGRGLNENLPASKNLAEHSFNDNKVCTVCGFNGRFTNYNDDCIICETCKGCIKTECVHSEEDGHKFCGDIENAKTVEIEAEDAEVFNSDGSSFEILDYSKGGRACIHPDYGNVKFTITVNKACTVTLKLHNGNDGEFSKRGTIFVNGDEYKTNAYLAQPKSSDTKCSFVWNTMGCINLVQGVNEIEIYQYKGGWEFHLDKIALISAADVEITYEPIDNSKYTTIKALEYLIKDDAFNLLPADLKNKKYKA